VIPKPSSKWWNRETETLNPSEREQIILKKLKWLLKWCSENSIFYHKLYESAGLDISGIQTLEQFAEKVPPVNKSVVRLEQEQYPPFGRILCSNDYEFVMASSGTTGRPTYVPFSQQELQAIAEAHSQIMWSFGIRPGMGVLIAAMFTLYAGAWGVYLGARNMGLKIYPAGGGSHGATINAIKAAKDLKPEILYGTPSFVQYFFERARDLGYDPSRDFNFKIVFGSGEPGLSIPAVKQKIRKLAGDEVKVIDTGSMVEAMPWMTNAECEYENGMHLWQDFVYTEIVDPNDFTRKQYGEEGVLTYTSLLRTTYPLVRYFSGDVSFWTDEPCECERTYPRLPRGIYGRSDDMIVIKGVKLFPSLIQQAVERVPAYNGEFRIVLGEEAGKEYLKIVVEVTKEVWERLSDKFYRDSVEAEFRRAVRDSVGLTAFVELAPPGSFERALHKAKRIIDERSIAAELAKLGGGRT
jgi:phenylacetate-CoA ligase